MSWKITRKSKAELKDPILIVGLPGIGNVGKITVDFMIQEMKAKKLYSFFSNTFPHSVFVNDKNLIELPSISIHYSKKNNLLLLSGDIQPSEERSCYDFCEIVDKICNDMKVKEIVTLAGIGLREEPNEPKLFCTGNNAKILETCPVEVNRQIYGTVGPILGVSGVLPGISKLPSKILLVETLGHPFYVGIKGAKRLLEVLKQEYKLDIKIKNLTREVKEIETELLNKARKLKELSENEVSVNYIG